jgi:hypothetical protein
MHSLVTITKDWVITASEHNSKNIILLSILLSSKLIKHNYISFFKQAICQLSHCSPDKYNYTTTLLCQK